MHDPLQAEAELETERSSSDCLPPFTNLQTAKVALIYFFFYFIASFFSNVAFQLTSPGSASILTSTCSFWTLLIGRLFAVEQITFMKLLSVIVSVGGVLLLGSSEFSKDGNTSVGNVCSLLSAVLYGFYSVYLKRATVDESRVSMMRLFAFVGFFTMIFTWPLLLLLHWLQVESFELPSGGTTYLLIAINILFGSLLPNYLWNVAFLYTSQMIVAIGLSMTIPLTLAVEFFWQGKVIPLYKLGSAACVIIGFSIMNLLSISPKYDVSFRRIFRLDNTNK